MLPGTLREEDSRAFFQWLSQQDRGVQAGHRDELRRHWSEISHGPLRWWEAYPDIQCLPIIAGAKLVLVSYGQAKARPVYLPDFPEINQQFARSDTRHGVVDDGIHRVFPDLRAKGILSLRDTLITKGTTTLVGHSGPAEKRHQETVRLIQMGASRRALARELDRVGLGRKSLMPDCMRMLEQLREARRVQKIIAKYRIGGATYEAEVSAALGDDNILWMIDSASDMAPFEAIAHRLVRAGDEAAPYKLFLAVQHLRAGVGPLLMSSLSEGDHEAQGSGGDQQCERQSAIPAPIAANRGGRTTSGDATPTFKEPAVPNPTPFPLTSGGFCRLRKTDSDQSQRFIENSGRRFNKRASQYCSRRDRENPAQAR